MAPTSDPDSSLVPRGLPVETDAFGNEIVRFGSGRPLTLIAVRRDVPAYFVTSITPDGYLRVQNQGSSPSLLWDQFQIGRRVFVATKDGHVVPGVVAAPNTHFRRGDDVPIPEATVDDIWVDVGAESDEQVRALGIENLCLVTQADMRPLDVNREEETRLLGPGAAVVGGAQFAKGLLDQLKANAGSASGSFAFVWIAQGSAGGRGAETVARTLRPDLAITVCPFVRVTTDSSRVTARPGEPAFHVTWIGSRADSLRDANANLSRRLLSYVASGRPDPISTALDRTGVPVLQVGIVASYPGTPGEATISEEWSQGREFGVQLLGGSPQENETSASSHFGLPARSLSSWPPPTPPRDSHSDTWRVLAPLVHAQGISEHEEVVRDTVLSLLPKSLKPVVDRNGNVIVRWGAGKPRRAFMAHMDEIGYHVTGADPDGRLKVEKKGGFYDWLYEGEIVRRGDGRLAVVAPRADYLARPRPTIDEPMADRHRVAPPGFKGLPDSLVRVDPGMTDPQSWLGAQITVVKSLARLGEDRVAGRSLDDRFGCTALILALQKLAHERAPTDGCVLFAFTVEEETGLRGAEKLSDDLLAANELPPIVHAVDTFVSSDTPLEDPRYAHAMLGKGCVIRAVDTGSAAPKADVDRVRGLAAEHFIPLQFGVTSGGNDGQPFAARGSVNVPLGWPLRYSHTQVETADLRDLEALARLVTELARTRPPR
jgi:putative aminopeptidase FrvX